MASADGGQCIMWRRDSKGLRVGEPRGMRSEVAGILSWGALLPPDGRLIKMLDFVGVPHVNLDLCSGTFDATRARLGRLCPIASASTIRHALSAGAPVKDIVRKLFEQSPAAFIYGVTPERVSAEELNSLIGIVATPRWIAPDAQSGYNVNSAGRDVSGAFSGLAWRATSWGDRMPVFERDAPNLETLVAVDGFPVFTMHRRSQGEIFMLCGDGVSDLDEVVCENVDVHKQFIELFPHIMFIRHAFRDACWRPGPPHGSLIIDDPPLRDRYGFLDFKRLVQAMDDIGFSSDIALIPWNFRRTQQSVAALINERRGRLGICIHGCDHTRSEFGASDREHLAKLAMIGLERMEQHRRNHGVDYERIMVFPQGVFSESAMEVLKSLGFLAAVNTEVVPSHDINRTSAVALADVLAPAITRYNAFPLFPRRKCSDHLVNFAADIFVGKPCLLVAHHADFACGGQPLLELIAGIRDLAPELQWSNLGTALRGTYLRRQESDGAQSIRMFANEIDLSADGAAECDARVLKSEGNRQLVKNVLIDGQPATFGWDGDVLTIPIKVCGGRSVRVRVVHHNLFDGVDRRLGVRHRFRTSIRRSLCDIRDNYVDVARLRLQRFWPGAERARGN
jgi:hypothetical protein